MLPLLAVLAAAAATWTLLPEREPGPPDDAPVADVATRADRAGRAPRLEGRGVAPSAPGEAFDADRARAAAAGADDPPADLVVLDPDGAPVPFARVTVTAPFLGRRFAERQAGPMPLGRRWLRAGAEVRVEQPLGADGRALPLRPAIVRITDPEADRIEVRLEEGRDLLVRVRDERGGPAPGVQVHIVCADPDEDARALFWNTPVYAVSDAAGEARFSLLPRRDLEARVEAEDPTAPRAAVPVPARLDLVTLVCPRGPGIEGRVLGPDGRPVAQATVTAGVWQEGEWWEERARTDAEGAFAIAGLPAGSRPRVTVTPPAGSGLGPEVLDDVPVGRDGLVVTLAATAAIRGLVVDADGRPAEGFRVRCASVAAEFDVRWVRPEPGGRGAFVVPDVPRGRYRLEALRPGPDAGRSETVEVPAPADGVRLVLARAYRLRGRVVEGTTRGFSAWWTSATLREDGVLDPDGGFDLEGLRDEPGTLYVGSLYSNRYALLRGIRPGGPDLEVTLGEGERMAGRVEFPSGQPGGLLYLVFAGDGFDLWEEVRPDGTFSVLGVPPGSYEVSFVLDEVRGAPAGHIAAGQTDAVLRFAAPR